MTLIPPQGETVLNVPPTVSEVTYPCASRAAIVVITQRSTQISRFLVHLASSLVS